MKKFLFILLGLALSACGPRNKTPEMVSFELLLNEPDRETIEKSCPDLYQEAVEYYKKANEMHLDNEPEEASYYVTLANITWKTAQQRSVYETYRVKLNDLNQRLSTAKDILTKALARKDELSKQETEQKNAINQNKNSLLVTLQNLDQKMIQADNSGFQTLIPAQYTKAKMTINAVRQTFEAGDVLSAARLATTAIEDVDQMFVLAQPLLEAQNKQKDKELKLNQLLASSSRIEGAQAREESRGVVVSIHQLFQQGKIPSSKHYLLEQLAGLIQEFPDFRVVVEGHVHTHKNAKQRLAISDQVAQSVVGYIKGSLPNTSITAIGRGDEVPFINGGGPKMNDRIEVVFFK